MTNIHEIQDFSYLEPEVENEISNSFKIVDNTQNLKTKKEEKLKKIKLKLVLSTPEPEPIYNIREYPSIPDDLNVYDIATQHIPDGWEDEFIAKRKELKVISNLLIKADKDGEDIAPSNKDIFRAFYLTRKQEVRVIIVGQDPYPTAGNANGLAFSTNDNVSVPQSLNNIFKEIYSEYPDTYTIPEHGNLQKWAEQGVFLINSCLTVPIGNANGHSKPQNFWLPFISHILETVTKYNKDVFVCLWGKNAQSMLPYIKSRKDRVLQASHPSPFSAHKGFFGCNHFKIINDSLKPKIDWQT